MTTNLGVPSASTPRASSDPEQLRAGLVEACDAIEITARYVFWHQQVGYEDFLASWESEDIADYMRWLRLKTLALGAAA